MYVLLICTSTFTCALISVSKIMNLILKVIITKKAKQKELQGLQNPGDLWNSSVNSCLKMPVAK